MRTKYTTSLEETLLKKTKIQAIQEDRNVNDIIEEALEDYFKKKGVK